jgi:hypothetical protein
MCATRLAHSIFPLFHHPSNVLRKIHEVPHYVAFLVRVLLCWVRPLPSDSLNVGTETE